MKQIPYQMALFYQHHGAWYVRDTASEFSKKGWVPATYNHALPEHLPGAQNSYILMFEHCAERHSLTVYCSANVQQKTYGLSLHSDRASTSIHFGVANTISVKSPPPN